MIHFTFESGSAFATVFLVAVACILLAGLGYYRALGMLKPRQWLLLLLLRSIAIVTIILLLFRPIYSYQKELTHKPALVFLVDTSQSMSISDDASGLNRFTLARQQVEKWWERLKDDFALHVVEFSERPRELARIEELAGQTPNGKSTSISDVLRTCIDELPRKEVEAVVLLSDGIHNTAGQGPVEAAAKLGVVVHTVGVGASLRSNTQYRDIQVTGVDCPERMMVKNKAQITGLVEAIGLGGHVTKVILEDDGNPIADQEITLDDIEGSQKVTFEITPTVKGRHTYTVRVPPAGEEKITENNKRSAVALVIEPGIRVLYVEGTIRAEYGALVDRFLSKDPDLEFCALVQTRRNTFLRRSNIPNVAIDVIPSDPEVINKFDVFIFGDLDSSFVKPAQQELIVKRVQEGAGIIMLGGYHSLGPGGYDGTPIGNILPVRLGPRAEGPAGQLSDPFLPVLMPDGVIHPIFTNVVQFFPTRQQPEPKQRGLPTLDGCTRIEGAKPGATVLAVHPGQGAMPVLTVQPVGKGRSAVFTGDTTRKWQQGPRALNQDSPFLQFWGQTVRWLAGRSQNVENAASLTAATDKGFYEPGEAIQITAIVRDEKGEGTAQAKVEAKIIGPAERPDQIMMPTVAGAAGHYAGGFDPKVSGRYRIVVEATVGGKKLTSEEIGVDVGRPNLEFEKLDLDDKMLSAIASAAGGRYLHIGAADHLVDQLNKEQRKKQEYFERRLYWPPAFWIVFVAAITVEWVLRRRFQLR